MTDKRQSGTSSRPRLRRARYLAPVAVIAAVALAGCQGGKPSAGPAASAPAASGSAAGGSTSSSRAPDTGTVSVVMLGGPSSDPFFSTIKAGANAAAAAYGSKLKLTYLALQNYDNLGPDMAKLLQTAGSLNPTIIVSTDWVPTAQDPVFEQLISKGTPVVLYNAGGSAEAQKIGAVTFVGTADTQVGDIAGSTFVKDGAKDIVCVNTTPGSQNNEDRCHGLIATATAAGAKATELELSPTSFGNPSAVTQAIKAELLKNPSVDGIFDIGAVDADSAAAGIAAAGDTGKVTLANAGVGTNNLLRIKAGTQAFLIDIEPYLQGYLAVSAAYQYASIGLVYTDPTPTGPVVITKSNVGAAIAASELGLR
jgi:simple sugar transport system substrate-binding protein